MEPQYFFFSEKQKQDFKNKKFKVNIEPINLSDATCICGNSFPCEEKDKELAWILTHGFDTSYTDSE